MTSPTDTSRVGLAAESAGGDLAVATAIYARDHGLAKPVHILAVHPIADSSKTLPSRMASANAKPLDAAMPPWFAQRRTRTTRASTWSCGRGVGRRGPAVPLSSWSRS